MYNGIEIDDTKLLIWVIISTLGLLFTVITGVVACFCFYDKENSTNAKRIKELRKKAVSDPIAAKRLVKMERKHKRKTKNDRLHKILVFSLISVLLFINIIFCVIPIWTDYIKKDYIVYEGNISVEHDTVFVFPTSRKTSTFTLDDGKEISGSLALEEGQYYKIIVYSKRSEILLGME